MHLLRIDLICLKEMLIYSPNIRQQSTACHDMRKNLVPVIFIKLNGKGAIIKYLKERRKKVICTYCVNTSCIFAAETCSGTNCRRL